jgi:hypothetical protein
METITLNYKLSDGDKVLLTEKTISEKQTFQFWYEGIKDPALSGSRTIDQARIEVFYGTDESLPFIEVGNEALIAKNGSGHGAQPEHFYFFEGGTTGVMQIKLPKGVFIRFILKTRDSTEGILTAMKLVNED